MKGLGSADYFAGRKGNDTIFTGNGEDSITMLEGDGKDRIMDFTPGKDVLHGDSEFTLRSVGNGHDTLVDFEGGYSALLIGVKKSVIGDLDIVF